MNPEQSLALRALILAQDVAALGTLHQGEPFVSMVPYAVLEQGRGFVIHVSRLATHTKDMLNHPAVSLLLTAPRSPEVPPQALPRVSVQGEAQRCGEDDPRYAEARAAYEGRFPEGAGLFGFGDFSLFVVVPRSLRYVGGFAQATSLSAETFAAVMGAA